MPRRARAEEAGAIYHVTARGNGQHPIFIDDFDRLYLLHLLAGTIDVCAWRCHAYCLMDTHYHVLVATPEPNLGHGMRTMQTRFAQRFNRRHGRTGHVFGDRYHARRIEDEGHLIAAVVYIVLNPVRAGVTGGPATWPWSSYRATAGLKDRPGFLAIDAVLDVLSSDRGRAQEIYRTLVQQAWGLSPSGDSPPLLVRQAWGLSPGQSPAPDGQ